MDIIEPVDIIDRTDLPTPETAPAATAAWGQQVARVTLALVLIALGAWTLEGFLHALVWAGVLAIATWPLYQWSQARGGKGRHNLLRPLAFTTAIALVFVIPLALVAMQGGREAQSTMAWIRDARAHGIEPPVWLGRLPVGAPQATAWWDANLRDPGGANALLERVDRAEVLQSSRRVGSDVARRGVLFGFTLLTLFFLYREGDCVITQMQTASRRLVGPHGEEVGRQIIASIHGTVNGMVVVGLGEGTLLGAGYFMAGVPHPVLLGLLTAIAAVIPLGAPVVLAVAALLVLAQGSTVTAAVLAVTGLVIVFVADHTIRPVLIGGSTKLPFLWVLLGILGGVETFGLIGLFVGPAIMAALILLWRDWTRDVKIAALPH